MPRPLEPLHPGNPDQPDAAYWQRVREQAAAAAWGRYQKWDCPQCGAEGVTERLCPTCEWNAEQMGWFE